MQLQKHLRNNPKKTLWQQVLHDSGSETATTPKELSSGEQGDMQ